MGVKHRKNLEIKHSQEIAKTAEAVWNYDSLAGQYRADKKAKMMIKRLPLKKGTHVLEVGCGTGQYSCRIAASGATLTSTDISEELLMIAGKHVKEVKFQVEDAEKLTFKDGSFDCVVGNSILHHLNIEPVLKEIFRVLKPGGKLMFYEPNMLNPYLAVQKNSRFIKKMTGDSPDETAFTKWRLAKDLRTQGFKNIKITPIDYVIPFLPDYLFGIQKRVAGLLERIPIIKEFSGVLMIEARR